MEDGREWLFNDKIAFTLMASSNVNFSSEKTYSITVKYKKSHLKFNGLQTGIKDHSKHLRLSVWI